MESPRLSLAHPTIKVFLPLLSAAVVGRGPFYFIALGCILLILSLSANTSFADFPRVCRFVAEDGFLPYSFATRGRRLVYSEGIWVLTLLSATLLVVFNGVTDKLIPLFAIGAFLAFTLSQAGMVIHWLKSGGQGFRLSAVINGIGALATGMTFLIVLVTKFTEGAWLVAIVIPALYLLMYSIKHHYSGIAAALATSSQVRLEPATDMVAVIPVDTVNALVHRALRKLATGCREESTLCTLSTKIIHAISLDPILRQNEKLYVLNFIAPDARIPRSRFGTKWHDSPCLTLQRVSSGLFKFEADAPSEI
jgi:hypothetical protein